MASLADRLPGNAAGAFFVDRSCIDCGACHWIAPATFDEVGGRSRVHTQPATVEETRRAMMALLACPVGAIGTADKIDLGPGRDSLPEPLGDGVFYLGYHSPKSFGAASYLIVRDGGNVLVDSPRFADPVVRAIEARGGLRFMFLSHMDDVADHRQFADRFGCERILHAADVRRDTEDVEVKIEGADPVELADDLTIIPVPGHTKGSMCLLYRNRYLFTGDHLAWSPALGHPFAFRRQCWYDWGTLEASMRRLARFDFEHILPGHGAPCHFPADRMRAEMARCLDWMETA
jgi:glyoxylase-like metal-dependent hydrolase (beta-lactamase superfamily II)